MLAYLDNMQGLEQFISVLYMEKILHIYIHRSVCHITLLNEHHISDLGPR